MQPTRDDLSDVAIACIEAANTDDGFALPRSTEGFRERMIVTGLLANDPPLVSITIVDDREIVRATDAGRRAIATPLARPSIAPPAVARSSRLLLLVALATSAIGGAFAFALWRLLA